MRKWGPPAFTHISYDDFRIIRTNFLEKGNATIKERLVPYTVFIDPQLGRVGLSETEARKQGYNIKVARMPMNYVARALEVDEPRGMMKAVVDADRESFSGRRQNRSLASPNVFLLAVVPQGGHTHS